MESREKWRHYVELLGNNINIITLWFKKKYFGANKVTLILRPIRLLASTDKEYDLDCQVYQGVALSE